MTVRANKPAFNIREKLKELTHSIGLKGRELMRAATVQEARDLVSAGRKNLIINGDMRIAQRGTSSSDILGSAVRTCDRWGIRTAGYTTLAGSSSQDPESPPGFNYSLKLDITTPETLDVGDLATIRYYFEDQDWQPSAYGTSQAKSATLSFWIRSSVAGTYTVNFYNNAGGGARSITLPYTINSADTWEYKSIIVPPDTDSTASFSGDNTRGMEIAWIFSAGSTYTGGDHTGWVVYTNDKFANGQTADLAGVVSNVYLTGVQLELGKNATEFEYRPYGEELALCERYTKSYAVTTSSANGMLAHQVINAASNPPSVESSWQCFLGIHHNMRITNPAVDFFGDTTAITIRTRNGGSAGVTDIECSDITKGVFTITPASSVDPSTYTQVRGDAASGGLLLDAEL